MVSVRDIFSKKGGKLKKYILVIMLLLMLCPQALAAEGVRIEMPDNVVSGEIFQVKLIIDDPLVKELTKTIDLTTYGNIMLKWPYDQYEPNEIEYAGQDELVFDAIMFSGVREDDELATLSFQFYGDTDEMYEKYPDWGTYYGDICKVSKQVYASPVSFYAELPDVPDGDFKTENWDKLSWTPSFSYRMDPDANHFYVPLQSYSGSFSRGRCYGPINDDYLLCKFIPKEYLTNPEEGMEVSSYSYGTFGEKGTSEGYYTYTVTKSEHTKYNDNGDPYEVYTVSASYTYEIVINDFLLYNGALSKVMQDQEDPDAFAGETLDEFHKIVLSQRYTSVGSAGGSYPSTFETNLPTSGPETIYITGSVSDADGNPLPYVKLKAKVKEEFFTGRTDEHGDFQMPISIKLDEDENDVEVSFIVTFSYERDDKNYFEVYDLGRNGYQIVWYYQKLSIIDKGDVEIHVRLDGSGGRDGESSTGDLADLKSLGVIYSHTAEAVDFCITDLGANISYKLPVEVLVGNDDEDTLYSPGRSVIFISSNDAGYSNSNRPKNREYHEFAHHLMFATYGDWTKGSKVEGNANHDGFLNPNTGDSFEEGFAEFMALVMSDKWGDSNPADGQTKSDVYASFGSLENNYHPWDGKGYDEEFAVASLLWDMYDSNNDNGDSLTMSVENIWSVLKVQRNDFYDYYVAFKEANPSKADEIDKLFIEHGFFIDTTEGNSLRDDFEGFRDGNNNGRYDVGEFFFDLGCFNSTSEIEYKKGMIIGKAANYERMNRSTAVRLDGAYLKVKDDEVNQYRVKVHYLDSGYGNDYEYVVDLRDGLLYVQPLPSDVPALISIEPYSVEYTAEDVYSISNQELISKLEEPDEYFDEHKFSLESTGVTGDMEYVVYKDTEPTYAYEGDLGTEIDVKISGADSDDDKGLPLLWLLPIIIIVVIIGVVAGAGVLILKKTGNKTKAQELIKKGSHEFSEKGMPAIKEAGKKAAEYTAKGAEFAAHQTKEGYEKAKPHMKKAQEDIKKKIDEAKEKKK